MVFKPIWAALALAWLPPFLCHEHFSNLFWNRRAIYCYYFFPAGFGFLLGFLVLCFPGPALIFCFSASLLFCFSASLLLCFPASASLPFCFPTSLLLCLSAFCCFSCFTAFLLFAFHASLISLLFCFSAFIASLLFLLLCFIASLLFLLICFSASLLCFSASLFSLLLCFRASVPFYLCYFTFSFHQSCVFACLLPAPLLLCFLSLLSLCFSSSFASFFIFFPVCILNETLERP